MDSELISKKDLLQQFVISYGALYRYKRMGLIPEEWFLRRSTPTGQETFFYRSQILPRMEQILGRGASLEDLAEELHQTRQRQPQLRLVVRDRYSTHSFFVDELESVLLIDGDIQTDLLEQWKGATR